MKSQDWMRKEREFLLLEKLDDQIVNLLDSMDKRGRDVKAFVDAYCALNATHLESHKLLLAQIRSADERRPS